jgi:hypothetical protein
VLVSCDVAAIGAERLGECSHEDVNFRWIDVEVIADTAASGTAKWVSLV